MLAGIILVIPADQCHTHTASLWQRTLNETLGYYVCVNQEEWIICDFRATGHLNPHCDKINWRFPVKLCKGTLQWIVTTSRLLESMLNQLKNQLKEYAVCVCEGSWRFRMVFLWLVEVLEDCINFHRYCFQLILFFLFSFSSFWQVPAISTHSCEYPIVWLDLEISQENC